MASQMEQLLGLGPLSRTGQIPGIEVDEGREVRYLVEPINEEFPAALKKLVRYVSPPIATQGGVVVEGCKLTLPTGEKFQAISYRGDVEGWRHQIEQGAAALHSPIGRIAGNALVLTDGRSCRLADCEIAFD